MHFAMSFLERWQRKQSRSGESAGEADLPTLAKGKRVVVIGGGDTGVDCIATAARQGAKSVETLEIMSAPPSSREATTNPWPEWPLIMRTEYGQEEVKVHYGRDPRTFDSLTKAFLPAPGNPAALGGLRMISVRWETPPAGSNARPSFVELPGELLACSAVSRASSSSHTLSSPLLLPSSRNGAHSGMRHGPPCDGLPGS